MNTNNAGGGEILQYWNQTNSSDGPVYLDTNLIKQFIMFPIVKVIIILLLMVICIMLILKLFQVRSPFKGKALSGELDTLDRIRKHEEQIIRANNAISTLTKLVQHSPFALNKTYVEYWTYNLTRANVRIPGGFRLMKPEEFNAIIVGVEWIISLFAIVIAVLINVPLGVVMIIVTFAMGSVLPMQSLRDSVKTKDDEIIANFADFYLMIHYVLLASAGTPIAGIMKSYDKTTTSEEMHRFVDVCIHYIDTYGEYEATRYIAKQYREINEVGKLMRLIRQANEGGDVRAELMGFRNELLAAKRYTIQKRMEKIVDKAKMSFNILMPILIQAIISAMAIYMDDISSAGSLF